MYGTAGTAASSLVDGMLVSLNATGRGRRRKYVAGMTRGSICAAVSGRCALRGAAIGATHRGQADTCAHAEAAELPPEQRADKPGSAGARGEIPTCDDRMRWQRWRRKSV